MGAAPAARADAQLGEYASEGGAAGGSAAAGAGTKAGAGAGAGTVDGGGGDAGDWNGISAVVVAAVVAEGAVGVDETGVAAAGTVVTGMWGIAGVLVVPESFGASKPIRTKTGSEAASSPPAAFRLCRRAQSR